MSPRLPGMTSRFAAWQWGTGASRVTPFSLLPPPRCMAGPGAPAEQQAGPAQARWGCGFAPRLFGPDGDLSICRSMQFLLFGKWFWWHSHAPGSFAQMGCQQIHDQDDPGRYQNSDPRLAHSALTFNVTTMPGSRTMPIPAGSSVNSEVEAGRPHSPMRLVARASDQRKITWLSCCSSRT